MLSCFFRLLSLPQLSIIIPTHKRASILRECLKHIEQQTVVEPDLEVIVVSDGHDPETAALFMPGAISNLHLPLNFFEIPKSQQGIARNEGVKHATGTYVLFIGDDIFLAPNACELHLEDQKRLAISDQRSVLIDHHLPLVATLGFTTWDPSVGITPVMEWLEKSGWQFGYSLIERYAHAYIPQDIQHRFTYASHICLPLELAKKFPFRTDVQLYGWEDSEWGMRLRNAGVRLLYESDAKALHHHKVTLEESLKRMETLGRSAVEIQKKVPEFDRVPMGWKRAVYALTATMPTIAGSHRRAFLRGLKN